MAIPQALKKSSAAQGETNDCTVIAVAIATGKAYDEVHNIFRRCGRKRRRGCSTLTVVEVLSVKVDYQLFEVAGFFLATLFYNLEEALVTVLLVQAVEYSILVLPLF